MKSLVIKLRGDAMFNLRFIFSPGSCGFFCLRYILKKKIVRERYISLFAIKEILFDNGYYCDCLKVKYVLDVKSCCLTLINCKKGSMHYIVIKAIRKGKVYYYDPLFLGLRKKKVEDFAKKWSGICLFYTKV
jgi:ABC-type bacteriocin/lantibiotic exporter with double-glycine peptidase domain